MVKNIDKTISKNLSSKYSQKILDNTKQSATDALKGASKRAIQKTAEATGDLIGLPKTSPKNNSESNEEEILREKYIQPELRQKIIDDLRLKEENCWWSKINTIMEYQKIVHLLNNTTNQPSKFRTKNWVEKND